MQEKDVEAASGGLISFMLLSEVQVSGEMSDPEIMYCSLETLHGKQIESDKVVDTLFQNSFTHRTKTSIN